MLYIVGTPIGNLGDLSPRARETLTNVDFIAAEDTRVSGKIMQHIGVKKPMVSYYQHNIRQRGEEILARMLAGESCAIITDAGMPCISDPGEDLVRLCHEHGVKIQLVPSATAATSALAASGLATGRFAFEGFLSVKKSSRMQHLADVKDDTRTLIFYEAPHKLRATLADMAAAFGADRELTLARELTKLHEEIVKTTFAAAIQTYTEREPRGEYVLVIAGAPPKKEEQMSLDQAVDLVIELQASGKKLSDAAREIGKQSGYKKGELYTLALKRD